MSHGICSKPDGTTSGHVSSRRSVSAFKQMLMNSLPFRKSAAPECTVLNIVTWNIAAVNNNPFEYWVTHHDPGYNRWVERDFPIMQPFEPPPPACCTLPNSSKKNHFLYHGQYAIQDEDSDDVDRLMVKACSDQPRLRTLARVVVLLLHLRWRCSAQKASCRCIQTCCKHAWVWCKGRSTFIITEPMHSAVKLARCM
jgi:hypothetical protein